MLEAAPRLLGATFTHGGVTLRLTEVEAYDGDNDPGSHANRGRTERNKVMFGPAGHLYVYFTYGMHHCCNVSCGPQGTASAILLRAGEVVDGLDTARARRPAPPTATSRADPAGCARPWGSTVATTGSTCSERLRLGPALDEISTGPRVGLRLAADRPWRFWITGDPTVSRYVAAKPRPRTRTGHPRR